MDLGVCTSTNSFIGCPAGTGTVAWNDGTVVAGGCVADSVMATRNCNCGTDHYILGQIVTNKDYAISVGTLASSFPGCSRMLQMYPSLT